MASICIKSDLSKTWVLARHDTAHSILRFHKGISYYFVGKYGNWMYASDDFLTFATIEGVLWLSEQYSPFLQHEQFRAGALGIGAKITWWVSHAVREHLWLIFRTWKISTKQKEQINRPNSCNQWDIKLKQEWLLKLSSSVNKGLF